MSRDGYWMVSLDGVTLMGGDPNQVDSVRDIAGCLTMPPDGLGMPELRTEDITYPQRDGIKMFGDWYTNRIITLENVKICAGSCADCPSPRDKVRDIMDAWSRRCDETELVIFTDCHDPNANVFQRELIGPFGVRGRPRVANLTWDTPTRRGCATMTLRFDALDQHLYILDPDGNPGSGEFCVDLTASVDASCRNYPRCYTGGDSGDVWCYDQGGTDDGTGGIVEVTVAGNEPVFPTIRMTGLLTTPFIENLQTGETIGHNGVILGGETVTFNTELGTATKSGSSVTHRTTGNPRFTLQPGTNFLRLSSFGTDDNGAAEVCWRPTVTWA